MKWFSVQLHDDEALASWHGEIGTGAQSAADFIAALGRATRVYLRIDSGGGDTLAALEMFDVLRSLETAVHVPRLCGSAALLGAMAARTVRVGPTARFLWHSPVRCVVGDARFLRETADGLDAVVHRLVEIYAKRLRLGPDEIRALLSGGDTWMEARRAVEIGLADTIVDDPAPQAHSPSPTAGADPEDDGSERLLLDLVAALGPIRVRDRAAFARNLNVLLCQQVTELPRSACAEPEGSPVPSAGRAPGEFLSSTSNLERS